MFKIAVKFLKLNEQNCLIFHIREVFHVIVFLFFIVGWL